MFYYEVLVSDSSYKRSEPLTYCSDRKLAAGTLVRVGLKRSLVNGVLRTAVPRPAFASKPITEIPDLPALPAPLIALAEWMGRYYAAGIGEVMQHFLPASYPPELSSPKPTPASSNPPLVSLPALTPEQQTVLGSTKTPGTYLLHGDTGSGKTRIYIELALRAFHQQRSSLILTPEIGLTPQLAKQFQDIFGQEHVIVTHSQLTTKARIGLWQRMLGSTTPLVVIGPRSALFSPLAHIGLIVLDEAHETSYKQEQIPHYHAASVAAQLARLHNAWYLLGSGTPGIVEYHQIALKNLPILRMQTNARQTISGEHTHVRIVDLKQREHFTKQPHLSNELITSISKALEAGEQSLVFLNRRGTARSVLCEHCGWQAVCARCDLPLTYHGDSHHIRCHTCGFMTAAPSSCPACSSVNIIMRAVGTKAIVSELQAVFPEANIQRFDKDNKKAERLEAVYESVRSGEVDIMVGTQLLAKGLDLPHLSVVGVVIADTSLYLPDYTATERTYQLLRQVIGRVSRGYRHGTIILQTYDPDNITIQAALNNDWERFYAHELEERKSFSFPPYCFLLKLTCRRASGKSAEKAADVLAQKLASQHLAITIEGPSPAFHEKVAGKFQWQLIIKAKRRTELLQIVSLLPANWSYNIDPSNLL